MLPIITNTMFFRRPSCLERRPHSTRKRACSMKLSFQTAGPDGARTLLVKTSVSPDAYQDLTQRSRSVQELKLIIRWSFYPSFGGLRLETAAGALSGPTRCRFGRREPGHPAGEKIPGGGPECPRSPSGPRQPPHRPGDRGPAPTPGPRHLSLPGASRLTSTPLPGLPMSSAREAPSHLPRNCKPSSPSWPRNGRFPAQAFCFGTPRRTSCVLRFTCQNRHPSLQPVSHCWHQAGCLHATPAGGTA